MFKIHSTHVVTHTSMISIRRGSGSNTSTSSSSLARINNNNNYNNNNNDTVVVTILLPPHLLVCLASDIHDDISLSLPLLVGDDGGYHHAISCLPVLTRSAVAVGHYHFSAALHNVSTPSASSASPMYFQDKWTTLWLAGGRVTTREGVIRLILRFLQQRLQYPWQAITTTAFTFRPTIMPY